MKMTRNKNKTKKQDEKELKNRKKERKNGRKERRKEATEAGTVLGGQGCAACHRLPGSGAGRGRQCLLCWDLHLTIASTEGGPGSWRTQVTQRSRANVHPFPAPHICPSSAPRTPLPRLLGLAIRQWFPCIRLFLGLPGRASRLRVPLEAGLGSRSCLALLQRLPSWK